MIRMILCIFRRDRHAEMYYEAVRNSQKTDIVRIISKNTGMSEAAVSKVYDHVFIDEHEHLEQGLMKKFGFSYEEAHRLAERKYNYREALEAFKKGGG